VKELVKKTLSILYVGINKLRKPRDVFILYIVIIGMKIHPISVLFNIFDSSAILIFV
jgi:hypothetical protein